MKALVIGIGGMIGRALADSLRKAGHQVTGTSRHADLAEGTVYLDLADERSMQADLPEVEVAFFCAAMSKFDDCRKDEELARRVNATHPFAIARQLANRGTRVVLLSTSAVLDCLEPRMSPSRPYGPASAYGRTKMEAEKAFLSLGPITSILRLTKVMVEGDRRMMGWVDKLRLGEPIDCADDFRISPIGLDQVVNLLAVIAGHPEGGMFQVSAASNTSYAEVAWHIADRLNVPRRLARGRSAASLGIGADMVTAYTSLDVERLHSTCGFIAPDPRDVIDAAIASMLTAGHGQSLQGRRS